MINYCNTCNGSGKIQDPDAKWWQSWKHVQCSVCGGDGYIKPPSEAKTTVCTPVLLKKECYVTAIPKIIEFQGKSLKLQDRMLAVLVKRLGGEVTLTGEELAEINGMAIWTDGADKHRIKVN